MAKMRLSVAVDFSKTGNGLEVSVSGIGKLSRTVRIATGDTTKLVNSVQQLQKELKLAGAIGVTAFAWKGFDALKSMLTVGVSFNSQMEQSRLGLAAIIGQFATIRDTSGNVLTGFNNQLRVATELQEKLKVLALRTTAEYSDLVRALQSSLGPALRAFAKESGDTLEKVLNFTQSAALAWGAMGRDMSMLPQEMRALLKGEAGPDNELVNMLFADKIGKGGGLQKYIKELQDAGKYSAELEKRMKSFTEMGQFAGDTIAGKMSNLKDAFTQALGAGTQGQFGKLNQLLADVTAKIVTFDEKGRATFNQEFVNSVANVAGAFVDLATSLAKVVTQLPALIHYVGELSKPNGWKVLGALSGMSLGALAGHPLAGAAIGYGLSSIKIGDQNAAQAQDIHLQQLNNFNKYLKTLPTDADRARAKAQWLVDTPSGKMLHDTTGVFSKPQTHESMTFIGPPAPTGLRVTANPLPPAPKEADKAREAAVRSMKEQLAAATATSLQLDLQLRIARETDAFRRRVLETDLRVLEILHQQAAAERAIQATEKLTLKEKDALITASLQNTQKQIAVARENLVREQLAPIRMLETELKTTTAEWQTEIGAKARAGIEGWTEKFLERVQTTLAQARAEFEEFYASVGSGIKSAFTSLATGRGLGAALSDFFGEIFSTIGNNFGKMIDEWTQRLALMATGQDYQRDERGNIRYDDAGNPLFQRRDWGTKGKVAQFGMAALQGASAAYGVYTNPGTRAQNMMSLASTGGAIGGMLAGAQAGGLSGPWGAIIGAVVGAIVGAFMPTEKGKNIRISGTAGAVTVSGMDSGWGADKLLREINQAVRGTAAKLDAIFVGLPTAALEAIGNWRPDLSKISVVGKGDGKNWNEELDAYLRETLPKRVFEAYDGAIQGVLTFAGVTEDRIRELTRYLGTLKTDEAIAALSSYLDVVYGLIDITDMFGTKEPSGRRRAAGPGRGPSPGQEFTRLVYERADAGPLAGYEKLVERMAVLSTGFDDLTHEEQVTRGKQILDLSREFFGGIEEYLLNLRAMQRGMNEAIEDTLKGIRFDQITEPKKRVEFVMDEQRRLRDELSKASTADEVNRIVARMTTNAASLYQLLERTPEAAKLAEAELLDIQRLANERYKLFEQNAQTMLNTAYQLVNAILEKLRIGLDELVPGTGTGTGGGSGNGENRPGGGLDPAYDNVLAFSTATASATAVVQGFTPSVFDAAEKVASFSAAVAAATIRMNAAPPPGAIVVEMGDIHVDVTVAGTAEQMIDRVTARATSAAVRNVFSALEQRAARARATGRG